MDQLTAELGKRPVSRHSKLIETIREICQTPEFLAEAARADRENKTSQQNVLAIGKAGLIQEFLPREYGGQEMSSLDFVQVIEEIAKADCSTATVWNMNCTGFMYVSLLPQTDRIKAVVEDARVNNVMMCGGVSAPTGELDASKGGFVFRDDGDHYLVSGRGGFATGSETSKYFFLLGAAAPADATGPVAVEEVVFAISTLADEGITNAGNWDAMGQRATGSHDIIMKNWRVRKVDTLTFPAAAFDSFKSAAPTETSVRRLRGFLGIIGCQIGAAARAQRLIIEHLNKRKGTVAVPGAALANLDAQSTSSWARGRLGRLDAALYAARLTLHDFARKADLYGDRGAETQHDLARTLISAKLMLEEFQTGITALTGAHGYVASSPLNLALRDLIGYQAQVWRLDELMQVCGTAALGQAIFVPGLGGT